LTLKKIFSNINSNSNQKRLISTNSTL